jgi:transglutaminase-like putative cysteine protease
VSSVGLRPPRAGWLGLAMLGVMLLSMAWSVQAAQWIERLDALVPVVLLAGAAGALLGMSRLSVAIVLPASALLGTGLVAWLVGGEYFGGLGAAERFWLLRDDVLAFAGTVMAAGYPAQLSPYALGIGLIGWTTAFVAAYTFERHGHAFDAVLLVGAALVANMSATLVDLFGYLLLFVLAALLLLLRHGLAQREESWVRRRVTENGEVPAGILRSGVLFTGATIALAWVMTSVAVAAPLTSAWRNLDLVWTDVSDRLDTLVGGITSGDARISGTAFGQNLRVSGSWFSKDDLVLTVASQRAYYLRAVTYDQYTGLGWRRSDGTRRSVAPSEPIFPGETAERPRAASNDELETISIEVSQAIGRNLFSVGYPIRAYVPMVVYETAGQPVLGGLEAASTIPAGSGYEITSAILNATKSELAAAGTDYPDHIRSLYLSDEGVSDRTRELARQVVDAAGATDPYYMAEALANFLARDESFTYSTEAPLPGRGDGDIVDFFLFDGGRIGYCEYFASAMTMMARSLGLPARLAVGFAPGERAADGTFEVRERNAHAWTEIYFPGYGWQIFEATKTINPRFVRSTGATTPGLPTSRDTLDPLTEFEARYDDLGMHSTLPSLEPLPGGFEAGAAPPADEVRESNAALLLALLVLAGGLAYWTLYRSRRGDRRVSPGQRAWFRLALAAERAGVSRRPAETMYEYAGWLEDQMPGRRADIRTIADGTVWQAYSGRRPTSGLLAALETAWRRLRLPMLWLMVRRRAATWLPRRAAR